MKKSKRVAALFVLALGMFSWDGVAAEAWDPLPVRTLEIEGGAVAYQGAVILDTRKELRNIYVQNYPIRYILPTANRTDRPVWVEAEWRVPGDEMVSSTVRLAPAKSALLFVDTKEVVWDTPVPVGLTVYADENKQHKLGGRDINLLFRGEDKAAFIAEEKRINTHSEKSLIAHGKTAALPIVSGIRE